MFTESAIETIASVSAAATAAPALGALPAPRPRTPMQAMGMALRREGWAGIAPRPRSRLRDALIVESDPAMAERLRQVLWRIGPSCRIQVARSDAEALDLLAVFSCTLALIDIDLPDGQGQRLIGQLRDRCPGAEPVAMSRRDDDATLLGAIGAGAAGYLLKGASDLELGYLLGSIERGGAPMDPRVGRRLLALVHTRRPGGPAPATAAPEAQPARGPLSPREWRVLQLIAAGRSNREIANAVFVSINTVEFHTKSIYRKLSVRSRMQAVLKARQEGLLA